MTGDSEEHAAAAAPNGTQTSARAAKKATTRSRWKATAFSAGAAIGFGLVSYGASGPASPTTPPTTAPAAFPVDSPCPRQGDGKGDATLDSQKNRYLAPTAADMDPKITTAGDLITQLPQLKPSTIHREKWPDSITQQVDTYEAKGATIEGYMLDAKEEDTGGGESCNCHDPEVLFDYHIYIADKAGVPKAQSTIVEMTPRWRSVNPNWNANNQEVGFGFIHRLIGKKIRVTGWLLFDQDHVNNVGDWRATVWEIHPVTVFEYQQADGSWKEL